MKITIDNLFVNLQSKAGVLFKSPNIVIKFTNSEGNQKSCSGFVGKDSPALTWKKGDSVELTLSEKNGYLNFDDPFKPVSQAVTAQKSLEQRVSALEAFVFPSDK